MPQSITTPELISAIGSFLTLTSLLGSFFYVHLSNWFREILELASKYEENSVGDEERRKQARVECRFQLKRLLNHVPLLISTIITIFIFMLVRIAVLMIAAVNPRPAIIDFYQPAFLYFLATYLFLTLYFLIRGYALAFKLKKRIYSQ
jgi:hypothetical protein